MYPACIATAVWAVASMISRALVRAKATAGAVVWFIGLAAALIMSGSVTAGPAPSAVKLPSGHAFPESITSTADGTLYVGSFAEGGVLRVRPGAYHAEAWIKPGAYDSRSTFGVLADEPSQTLWVCSNDASGMGVPGPSSVKGSALKGFDLKTGEGTVSATLPGEHTLCNDIAVGPDGSVYVTNSLAPQILRLTPGSDRLEVWVTGPRFEPPANGAGLDGIAFGADGNLYVNKFTAGKLYRIDVKGGVADKITALKTSRPLVLPDGLRPSDGTFLMIEGAGKLDRVTVRDDKATIETIKGGFSGPTGLTQVGNTAWVAEGQLAYLLDPNKKGQKPRLSFHLYAVPLSTN